MPGYILHLTAAEMALDIMEEQQGMPIEEKRRNEFLVGNLLPDTVTDKTASHFRNPKYSEEMIEYPDLEMFLKKYKTLLGDMSCLGYYFHLYIDKMFFTEYLPGIVTFLNQDGKKVSKRDEVAWVRINRTGQQIARKEFFSKEYYYGDYTRMNTYLVERFRLLLQLNTNVVNPGIKEVDYQDTDQVLKELQGYLSVPEDAVKNLRVFEVEKLLQFLRKSAERFWEK